MAYGAARIINDVRFEDRAKALDMNFSMRGRHWGGVRHLWEGIKTGKVDWLTISFRRPQETGPR